MTARKTTLVMASDLEAGDERSERSDGGAAAVHRMRYVGGNSLAIGAGVMIAWLTELPDGSGVLFPYVMSIGGSISAFGGLLLLIAHLRAGTIGARSVRQTCSTRSSDASRVVSAVSPVATESDGGRPSAVETRRRLLDAIRPELHDEDGDATLVIGNERSGRRMLALVVTDVRVLVIGATLYGRPQIKCCSPRSEVHVARFHERRDDSVLQVATGTRTWQIGIARGEHERAKAVVGALGGYPQRRRLSLLFSGTPPQ